MYKKNQGIILFTIISVLFLLFGSKVYSQQYYPLKTGNKFIYHYSFFWASGGGGQFSQNYDYVCEIKQDTIISSKKYYYVRNFPFASDGWFRVDSLNGSLYRYDSTNSCQYYYYEKLIDSLQMGLYGTSNSCSAWTVSGITAGIVWGQPSTNKSFHRQAYPSYNDDKIYNSFFGITYYSSHQSYGHAYSDETQVIKGCVIDGVIYGDTVTVGIEENTSQIAVNYSLSQNYPNPFNPTTKIKFNVMRLGDVKIVVYDITGRGIQTLVNERLQPGTYETSFDGSQLTSGIYFYRIITDGFSEAKKMLLIK